ncbi:hypothetical protein [Legionella fallonii]|nr:hypothetical protein [Legionella fallonii]
MKSQSIVKCTYKLCSILLFILPTALYADPKINNLIKKPMVEPVLKSYIEPYDSMICKIPSIPDLKSHKTIADDSVSIIPQIKNVIPNKRPTDIFAMLKNHPSHFNAPITQSNIRSAVLWNQQVLNKPNSRQWMDQIHLFKYHYQKQFERDNRQRFNNYEQYWKNGHYHNQYGLWHKWGFYGGFWYPTRPFFAIENYFTYPTVQWLFVDDSVAPGYFKSYYSEKMLPPDCLKAFTYKNIYFPSDTLRDLLVEASAFPQNVRCNFRLALINITAQLKKTIDEQFFILFTFKHNDIVINHYQNLQNKAIVVAGFINQGKIKVAFEALMDLKNPNQSIIFIPESSKPTDKQLQQLYQLTNRIRVLGGNPFTASQEPSLNNYNPVNLE